jgi:hypothetical protein
MRTENLIIRVSLDLTEHVAKNIVIHVSSPEARDEAVERLRRCPASNRTFGKRVASRGFRVFQVAGYQSNLQWQHFHVVSANPKIRDGRISMITGWQHDTGISRPVLSGRHEAMLACSRGAKR